MIKDLEADRGAILLFLLKGGGLDPRRAARANAPLLENDFWVVRGLRDGLLTNDPRLGYTLLRAALAVEDLMTIDPPTGLPA